MTFTYDPLWKMLIDKKMNKQDLRKAIGLSPSTIAKMGKDENVSLDVIEKICEFFDCQPNDVFRYIREEK